MTLLNDRSVSYTHLDVYKRQGFNESAGACGFESSGYHGTAQYAAYAENTVHVTTVDAAEAHVLFVGRSAAAGIFVVYAAL